MAKAKSPSNYDVVGGIFDFIFTEAEKPVDKRRPVRPTGFSAEGALTDAMLAALEKPGVFMSNNIIDEFNSALDINIAQVDFNEYGKIKLSTKNLAGYLKDPAKQIKGTFDRAKGGRKSSRVRMLGETMDDFITTAWAQKYGNLEAKKITLANASANEKTEAYKIAKAVGESHRPVEREAGPGLGYRGVSQLDRSNDFMIDRTIELMGSKTFRSDWDSLPESDKVKFANFLSRGKVTPIEIQQFLDRNYGNRYARNFSMVLLSFGDNEPIEISDPEVYKTIENDHITGRINALSGAAPNSPEEKQRKIYKRTKVMINLRTQKQIEDLTAKLADPSLSPIARARISQAILDGEAALESVWGGQTSLVSTIGKWEGYINSINATWGGVMGAQNLVPSILNGDFFDPDKNTTGPTKSIESGIKDLEGMKIVVARTDKNRVINAYNQMGESLYYMTPRSIFRTFFVNGEGFARLLNRDVMGLKDLESKLGGFGVRGYGADEITKSIKEKVGRDLDNYLNTALGGLRTSGSLSAEDLEKISKLLNSSKNMRNLTHFFSLPARLNGAISNQIKNVIGPRMKKARAKIVATFLKNKNIANWVAKTGGGKLLRTFIQEGGLKNLLKPIITAIAGTLGIALTPIVGFLISVATSVAMEFAMKGVKVLFQIGQVVLIALVAVLVLGLGGAKKTWNKFNKKSYSYNYVVPDTVKQCDVYEDLYAGGIEGPFPYPGPYPLGPDFPPYPGGDDVYEIFAQAREYVSSNFRPVSADLVLVTCPGHDRCDDIQGGVCYSAGSIYCKADKLPGATPQYIFELSVHELLHQIQGRGACNTDMREWGADYLSNNGGGYSFSTSSGCRRATQIDTSSCSGDEARDAALCWDTSTSCWNSIRSQINGRFCN
jgi:hypothetical protein